MIGRPRNGALIAAMAAANEKEAEAFGAEKYRWQAVWWWLHSKESANPSDPRQYAKTLMGKYREHRSSEASSSTQNR